MFSVAAATFQPSQPLRWSRLGVPAAPQLREGGSRHVGATGPHTGRIRRGELDAAFFSTANATADRSHKK